MVRFRRNEKGVLIEAAMLPPNVYLDNWACIDFARDSTLGERFAAEMRLGGTLLYSLANFMDLAKARPETQESVLGYLERVGDRWFPLNPISAEVIRREQSPTPGLPPCFDNVLLGGAFPHVVSKEVSASAPARTSTATSGPGSGTSRRSSSTQCSSTARTGSCATCE